MSNTHAVRMLAACGISILLSLGGGALAQQPLKIASLAPVTGGGASIGAAQMIAVRMAAKEINANGGILGRQIVVVPGDTQTDLTVSAGEAKRLAFQEKVDVVIGPLVTQEIMPTLPVFTEAKLPQISTTGSSAVTPQVGPYHFAFNNSSDTQIIVMANFAKDTLKAKKIAVLGDDGGQSKSGIEYLKDYAKKIDLDLVSIQEYRFRADDLTPQILALRRTNPDALLFITSTLEDTVRFLNGRKDLGWDVPVVGQLSIPTYAAAASRQTGPEGFRGVYGQTYGGLTYCTNDPLGSNEFNKFKERLKVFSPESDGKVPVSTALYIYDSVFLMKAALEGAGSTDGQAFQQWMYAKAGTVNNLISAKGLQPTPASHFVFGPGAYVMAERPDQVRADGMMKRAGC